MRNITHNSLHIRSAADAHVVFEAVRTGVLPMVRRRLSPVERDQLRSGQVFVWEEADQKGGLERWTDGRRWSQSRMREPFLFYEEKVQPTAEEKEAKAARRARKSSLSDPCDDTPPIRRQDRPSKPDGLTKQTYSSYVHFPASSTGPKEVRKWHCVAYFTAADYAQLPVIEMCPELRNIAVPEDVYVSSKGAAKKARKEGKPLSLEGIRRASGRPSEADERRTPSGSGSYGEDGWKSPWSSSTSSLPSNSPSLPHYPSLPTPSNPYPQQSHHSQPPLQPHHQPSSRIDYDPRLSPSNINLTVPQPHTYQLPSDARYYGAPPTAPSQPHHQQHQQQLSHSQSLPPSQNGVPSLSYTSHPQQPPYSSTYSAAYTHTQAHTPSPPLPPLNGSYATPSGQGGSYRESAGYSLTRSAQSTEYQQPRTNPEFYPFPHATQVPPPSQEAPLTPSSQDFHPLAPRSIEDRRALGAFRIAL